jgi:serine protease Do
MLLRRICQNGCAFLLTGGVFWGGGSVFAGEPGAAVPPEKAANKAAAAMSFLRQIDEGFVAVFEKVAPSVVVVDAQKKRAPEEDLDEGRGFDFLFGDDEEPSGEGKTPGRNRLFRLPRAPLQSQGSGFIARPDGYILTNFHVVADSERVDVRFRDGRIYPAKIVGADDKTDIAVLRVEARDLPAVEWANSDAVRVGQLVGAIGSPFNQDYSFSCGWVSGKGRSNLTSSASNHVIYEDFIQTDAFINPGNSGGPLFDVEGRVVGMNTLINGIGRGLAFAIPSVMLREVSRELIETGRVQRSWLGIRIESLSANSALRERLQLDRGIVVLTIEANAPAHRSELRTADVVTEIDGVKLGTAQELQKEVLKKKIGQVVQLTVRRDGASLLVPVTLGELPSDYNRLGAVGTTKSDEPAREIAGIRLRDAQKPGARVVEVAPQSAAAKADLRPEDLILEVDGKPVANSMEAHAALRALEARDNKPVALKLERKGRQASVNIQKKR